MKSRQNLGPKCYKVGNFEKIKGVQPPRDIFKETSSIADYQKFVKFLCVVSTLTFLPSGMTE